MLDGKAGVRAKGSCHVQLQGGKRGQVLLPHVVVSGRLLRVAPLRVVPESEEVQDLDARVPERNQDTQRRTRAELGGVLKPWAAHGRRPGGGKVHPRRVRLKLEAVARQLGADAGEQASRRVVGEEGEEEQIPTPVADGFVARANRFGLAGIRRNDADADRPG